MGLRITVRCVGGVALFAIFGCEDHRARRTEQLMTPAALAGLSNAEKLAYEKCIDRSFANIDAEAQIHLCREAALGLLTESQAGCQTDWDGRANPTMCD